MGLENGDGLRLKIREETGHEGGCAERLCAAEVTCAGCW